MIIPKAHRSFDFFASLLFAGDNSLPAQPYQLATNFLLIEYNATHEIAFATLSLHISSSGVFGLNTSFQVKTSFASTNHSTIYAAPTLMGMFFKVPVRVLRVMGVFSGLVSARSTRRIRPMQAGWTVSATEHLRCRGSERLTRHRKRMSLRIKLQLRHRILPLQILMHQIDIMQKRNGTSGGKCCFSGEVGFGIE